MYNRATLGDEAFPVQKRKISASITGICFADYKKYIKMYIKLVQW